MSELGRENIRSSIQPVKRMLEISSMSFYQHKNKDEKALIQLRYLIDRFFSLEQCHLIVHISKYVNKTCELSRYETVCIMLIYYLVYQ